MEVLATEMAFAEDALSKCANSRLSAGLNITNPHRHGVDRGYARIIENKIVYFDAAYGKRYVDRCVDVEMNSS